MDLSGTNSNIRTAAMTVMSDVSCRIRTYAAAGVIISKCNGSSIVVIKPKGRFQDIVLPTCFVSDIERNSLNTCIIF
jgi:hypothetical protein